MAILDNTTGIGLGTSIKKDPVLAAKEAVQQAKLGLHKDKIDLAVVFASIDLCSVNLLKTIASHIEGVPIIGCSGAAVISNHGILKRGVVIMLVSLKKDIYFNTACIKDVMAKTPAGAGIELGDKLLYGFHEVRRDLSLIFSDGLIDEGSNIIFGLEERFGRSFPLIGAAAADNLAFKKTYVFYNQELLNNAACGILWGGKLNFGFGIKHGWKPLGKHHTVTKARGNMVQEIDGVPAAKIYEDYLACDLRKLRSELKRVSIFYPIGIYLPGEEEYLLRNILYVLDNEAIIFQGNVPEGSQVRLMISTKENCLDAVHEALEEAKKGLWGYKSRFVLIFESISRYILLGRQAGKELEIIKEGLDKDTPIIGVYTYGEQAPLKAVNYQGRPHFHNQTITIVAMGG